MRRGDKKASQIDAEAFQKQLAEAKERDKVNEENARLANVEHVRGINRVVLEFMTYHGLPEVECKRFIAAIANKKLPQLTINY